jgi:hypothetical protein
VRVMGHVMRSQNHNSVMLRKKSNVRFPLTHISRGHCLEDKNVSNHHRRESAEQASEEYVPSYKSEPYRKRESQEQCHHDTDKSLPPYRLNWCTTKRTFVIWRTRLNTFAQVRLTVRTRTPGPSRILRGCHVRCSLIIRFRKQENIRLVNSWFVLVLYRKRVQASSGHEQGVFARFR